MYRLIKTCILCGQPIHPLRLVALPETRRCIHCSALLGTDMKKPAAEIMIDRETYQDLLRAIRS